MSIGTRWSGRGPEYQHASVVGGRSAARFPLQTPLARFLHRRRPLALAALGVVVGSLVLAGCSPPPSATPHPTPKTTLPTRVPPPTGPPGPPPTAESTILTTIAFFAPTTGYGGFVRSDPGANHCAYLVGRTTDGGQQFNSLAIVSTWACDAAATPGYVQPPQSLTFDNRGDGFSYDPQLFVTHDAGKHWTPSPQPGTVLSVAALGQSIWMVETECSSSALPSPSGCPLQLLESPDGGRSWASSPTQPPGAVVSANFNTGGTANGQTWLDRTSPTSAYVLSGPVLSATGASGEFPMWFTDNGGASWSERRVGCLIGAMSVVLSAAPEGSLMAVCGGQPGAGNQIKSTARSTDGGLIWSVHLTCGPTSACTSNPPSNPPTAGYVGEIDALSGNVAFLVGDRSSAQVTRDGGVDWAPVQPGIGDTAGGPAQVIFFDNSNGVVLGNGDGGPTIWSTSDGGSHWSDISPRTT
jgi:hypothetical protein